MAAIGGAQGSEGKQTSFVARSQLLHAVGAHSELGQSLPGETAIRQCHCPIGTKFFLDCGYRLLLDGCGSPILDLIVPLRLDDVNTANLAHIAFQGRRLMPFTRKSCRPAVIAIPPPSPNGSKMLWQFEATSRGLQLASGKCADPARGSLNGAFLPRKL